MREIACKSEFIWNAVISIDLAHVSVPERAD